MTTRNEFEKWFDNINDTTELPKNISNICNPTNLNYTEMYGSRYILRAPTTLGASHPKTTMNTLDLFTQKQLIVHSS